MDTTAFSEMMQRNTRIVSIKAENKAVEVEKNPDGSMLVVQGSGNRFTIPAEEIEMQSFVMWTMLNDQLTDPTPR